MTPAAQQLHDYLVHRAGYRIGPYDTAEDFVLDRGTWFVSGELSSSQTSIVLAAAARAGPMTPNHCFANASKLVLCDRSGELSYVEGFAMGQVMPVHHAWCSIGGKVIDLTWMRRDPMVVQHHRLSQNVLGVFGDQHAYMGYGFDRDQVRDRVAHGLMRLSFLDHPQSLPTLLELPRLEQAARSTS